MPKPSAKLPTIILQELLKNFDQNFMRILQNATRIPIEKADVFNSLTYLWIELVPMCMATKEVQIVHT
jgi:hypothetical protein